jgi:hypothetical protein
MTDLFGEDRPMPAAPRAPAIPPATLFDLAAEQAAIASGRPLTQERLRIMQVTPIVVDDGLPL